MKRLPRVAVAIAVVLNVGWATAGETVPLPPGFATKPTHRTTERGFYIESTGEAYNPFGRATIEQICRLMHNQGKIAQQPIFEPGYDKPLKTESWAFESEQRSVHFSTLHAYGCADPRGHGQKAGTDACGCTYRVQPHRTIHIKTFAADQTETLHVDLQRGNATRMITRGPGRQDPAHGADLIRHQYPEVVGNDTVAGIPCVIRRQRLGAGWTDLCIAEDPDARLPTRLRMRSLSGSTPRSKGAPDWNRATKVMLDAAIDTGAFSVPDGITVKDLR